MGRSETTSQLQHQPSWMRLGPRLKAPLAASTTAIRDRHQCAADDT